MSREGFSGVDGLFDAMLAEVEAGRVVAQRLTYSDDEVVFHEGDLGDALHMILRGLFAIRTEMLSGGDLIVDVLGPGEVFGEFAVFSPSRRRTASVSALTAGEALRLHRDDLWACMIARPEMIQQLIATITEKAEGTLRRLVELLDVSADIRVLRALLSLTRFEEDGAPVRVRQRDLASFAATTRPTANHVLREEARRGTLEIARGSITVLERDRIARRAKVDPVRPASPMARRT